MEKAIERLREQEEYLTLRLAGARNKEQEAYFEGMLYSVKFSLMLLGQPIKKILNARSYYND